MKLCRPPVAVSLLLTVFFISGWMVHTVQAAPLNQTHPDVTKVRVGIKFLEP